jgi:hypothetical protein
MVNLVVLVGHRFLGGSNICLLVWKSNIGAGGSQLVMQSAVVCLKNGEENHAYKVALLE